MKSGPSDYKYSAVTTRPQHLHTNQLVTDINVIPTASVGMTYAGTYDAEIEPLPPVSIIFVLTFKNTSVLSNTVRTPQPGASVCFQKCSSSKDLCQSRSIVSLNFISTHNPYQMSVGTKRSFQTKKWQNNRCRWKDSKYRSKTSSNSHRKCLLTSAFDLTCYSYLESWWVGALTIDYQSHENESK